MSVASESADMRELELVAEFAEDKFGRDAADVRHANVKAASEWYGDA